MGYEQAPAKMKAYLVLLVGVVSISFAAIFIRLAAAPALVIAAYRLGIASLVLLPVSTARSLPGLKALSRSDWALVLLSSLMLALHFGLWITSLSYTSIASSVILVTCHPAFVAVISFFLWKERLSRLTALGIVVAFGGVILINFAGFTLGSGTLFGDVLALVAGLAMGVYLIVGGQVRARIDILSYVTLVYSGAAVWLVLAAAISGLSFTGYSENTYLMLVLLAIVPQLIGHSSFNLAVRQVPVTFVSVSILGEPVVTTLLGFFILGEVPAAKEIIGGALILAGIFVVLWRAPGYVGMKRR